MATDLRVEELPEPFAVSLDMMEVAEPHERMQRTPVDSVVICFSLNGTPTTSLEISGTEPIPFPKHTAVIIDASSGYRVRGYNVRVARFHLPKEVRQGLHALTAAPQPRQTASFWVITKDQWQICPEVVAGEWPFALNLLTFEARRSAATQPNQWFIVDSENARLSVNEGQLQALKKGELVSLKKGARYTVKGKLRILQFQILR